MHAKKCGALCSGQRPTARSYAGRSAQVPPAAPPSPCSGAAGGSPPAAQRVLRCVASLLRPVINGPVCPCDGAGKARACPTEEKRTPLEVLRRRAEASPRFPASIGTEARGQWRSEASRGSGGQWRRGGAPVRHGPGQSRLIDMAPSWSIMWSAATVKRSLVARAACAHPQTRDL